MPDNKAFQKQANISLVMQTIRVKKEISRIDISRELGLDRSTITNIVSKLIDKGLLTELSEGASITRGGRKPVLIGVDPTFGLVLGLEIQVGLYRATLLNLNGDIVWNKYEPLDEVTDLYQAISNIYSNLEDEIKKEKAPLLGIGIGVPGHINPIEGKILASSPFYTPTDEYKDVLSNLFDIPVILDNDANCCAWGVLQQRKETGLKNFMYSIIELHGNDLDSTGQGLGFGIVINGQVYYGSSYAAGEMINSLIDNGDLETKEGKESYFNNLFQKLDNFVYFLNPSHLFLGGEFINNRAIVLETIKKLEDSGQWNSKNCEIVFSCHREFEVSFGAASMFVERLFKIPGVDSSIESELNWNRMFELKERRF